MFALHSAPARDATALLTPRVAAIVYADEAYPDATFSRTVAACRSHGLSLAGVLQHRAFEDPSRKCDVILEDLATGNRIPLFEDRGEGATGCRLDTAALAQVTADIERSLENNPGLLILNKFGKVEAGGEGLRDLIARAIDRDIPVIIGVPTRNLNAWRSFAGEFSVELSADAEKVWIWLCDLTGKGDDENAEAAAGLGN
jgi:hypothetical protein